MKFTDIVRDHYRGPAYGQEFTTWYTKVQHGFSTPDPDNLASGISRDAPHTPTLRDIEDAAPTPPLRSQYWWNLLRSSAISENVPDLSQIANN